MLNIKNKIYKEDKELFSYKNLNEFDEEKNVLNYLLNEDFYDDKKSCFSCLSYKINKRKDDYYLYESNFKIEKLIINDLNRINLIKRKEFINIKLKKFRTNYYK